jgi:hypothetical protein
MKLKYNWLAILMMYAICTYAGISQEAKLTARSESGKTQATIKIWDMDGPVSTAQLIIDQDTLDLIPDYDACSVIDLPNHILTLCFQQKGKPAGSPDAKSIKIWAVPSSFVKTNRGENDWRFKLKVQGSFHTGTTTMDGSFEFNP